MKKEYQNLEYVKYLNFNFICKNNRKSNKIMQCVDFLVVLKIWAFFTYFINLSVIGRYNPPSASKLS